MNASPSESTWSPFVCWLNSYLLKGTRAGSPQSRGQSRPPGKENAPRGPPLLPPPWGPPQDGVSQRLRFFAQLHDPGGFPPTHGTVSAPSAEGVLGHPGAAEAFAPQRAVRGGTVLGSPFATPLPAEPGVPRGLGWFLRRDELGHRNPRAGSRLPTGTQLKTAAAAGGG